MAEAILRVKLRDRRLHTYVTVDSAGTTGFHAGERPDPRTRGELMKRGMIHEGAARQVRPGDYRQFDVILALDHQNLDWLHRNCPAEFRHKLRHISEPLDGLDIPDPYYGGADGFSQNFEQLDRVLDSWLPLWEAQLERPQDALS